MLLAYACELLQWIFMYNTGSNLDFSCFTPIATPSTPGVLYVFDVYLLSDGRSGFLPKQFERSCIE